MSTSTISTTIYHAGELAVQQRAGSAEQAQRNGRVVGNSIIPGAIKFVKTQPFVVIGSVSQRRDVWASMLVGRTGFATAQPHTLEVDLSRVRRIEADPLWRNLVDDPRAGILAIDLGSRARLRINGRVEFPIDEQLVLHVDQAFPNCPQYIQRRIYRPDLDQKSETQSTAGTTLTDEQKQWISRADTLFVASEHPTGGLDASHRGGNPGFIQVLDSARIRIPDYSGNGMFNTLGNFAVNPRAGLLIPDFEEGRTLQLTGTAVVQWDRSDPQNETGGTGRFWEFMIERSIQIDRSLPGATEFLDYSPHNPIEAT